MEAGKRGIAARPYADQFTDSCHLKWHPLRGISAQIRYVRLRALCNPFATAVFENFPLIAL